MTAGSPPLWPSSRVLTAWEQPLASWQPRRLWVGFLLLHHVEALVRVSLSQPLDSLRLGLLEAARLVGAVTAAELEQHFLHLGLPVVQRLLQAAAADGLLVRTDERWALTPRGALALREKRYPHETTERRPFWFVERRDQEASPAPHFLALRGLAGLAQPVTADWGFDPQFLHDCVARPDSWKDQHQFPREVTALVTPHLQQSSEAAWQSLLLDRLERLSVAMVLTPNDSLLGFAVSPDGWELDAERPLFDLGRAWPEVFGELLPETPAESWQAAVQEFASNSDLRLDVERTERGFRVRGEISLAEAAPRWLLAGVGSLREAAPVEFAPVA